MIRRILFALALLLSTIVSAGAIVQPAQASDIYNSQAQVAVSKLLADYNGALFIYSTPGSGCGSETEGNCWFWGAVELNSLTTYAEDHYCSGSNCTTNGDIRSDLYSTYEYFCQGAPSNPTGNCPDTDNETSYAGPFTVNSNGNAWFDDIGYWTQTWINAYRWTGDDKYLYLAEGLWSYTTEYGWFKTCGGLVQYVNGINTSQPTYGTYDVEANGLYLANSASLYDITGWNRYLAGYDFGAGTAGGAYAADSFVRQNLIHSYKGSPGTAGSQFLILDHVLNPSCAVDKTNDTQAWLANQGEMVSAWSEMATAENDYCGSSCTVTVQYYNDLADELAQTVIYEQLEEPAGTCGVLGTCNWPNKSATALDLSIAPTVDHQGVLSEPCLSQNDSASGYWPAGCDNSDTNFPVWEIFKGLFQQGIYCLTNKATDPVTDSDLSTFITTNAGYIADLTDLGFQWDANGTANDGTRASALDGLDAQIGGSSTMC
jgi:hypothetical protein